VLKYFKDAFSGNIGLLSFEEKYVNGEEKRKKMRKEKEKR
jgi:hypothetical protein